MSFSEMKNITDLVNDTMLSALTFRIRGSISRDFTLRFFIPSNTESITK